VQVHPVHPLATPIRNKEEPGVYRRLLASNVLHSKVGHTVWDTLQPAVRENRLLRNISHAFRLGIRIQVWLWNNART